MLIKEGQTYTLSGVFYDKKNAEILAGAYAQVGKPKSNLGAKLVGAAAGAAVAGPVGAAVGFFLLGNRKR